MHFLRKTGLFCAALVGLLCLLYVATWTVVRTRPFHSWIEARAHDAGVELELGGMALVFPFRLVVTSIRATMPGRVDFTSPEIRADLSPLGLFFGQVNDVALVQPRIRLQLKASSKSGDTLPMALLVRSFRVEGAEVSIELENGEVITIPSIELRGQNLNLGSQSGEIESVAFIPELKSDLRIALSSTASAIKATVELHHQDNSGAPGTTGPKRARKGWGEVALQFEPDASLKLTGRATFDQIVFNSLLYSGNVALHAVTDSSREQVHIDLVSNTTHLAGVPPGVDLSDVLPFSTTLNGQYTPKDHRLGLTGLRISSARIDIRGRAGVSFGDEIELTDTVLEMRQVALSQLARWLPVSGVSGDISGNVSAKITMSGKYAPRAFAGLVEMTATEMSGLDTKIARLQGTIPFAIRKNHLTAGGLRIGVEKLAWRPRGQKLDAGIGALELKGKLEHTLGKEFDFNGAIDVRGGRFATADGLTAAEGIEGNTSIALNWQPDGSIRTQVSVELNAMEFLWNRFFGDFRAQKPRLNVASSYNHGSKTLRIERGRLTLANIGDVAFDGRLAGSGGIPAFELRVQALRLRLGNLYDFFVRDTFKTTQPLLGQLQADGTASTDTAVRGTTDGFSVEGTLDIRGAKVGRPDHWSVGPIDVALPMKIAYPQRLPSDTSRAPPRAGLAVGGVTVGDTKIPAFTVFLSLWDNALTLLKPLQIPIYGGAFLIERLAWGDIVAAPRNFSFAARIDDVSLSDMTRNLGWYELHGSLSGVIPTVRWVDSAFKTDGQLEVNVFAGRIRLDELEVSQLGTSSPAIKANVEVSGIDLAKATAAFEFGRISGIIAGSVEGLVISEGQPSQFRANFGTVEDTGMSQWISVEALNKIAILSSGSEGNLLYGTLAGFFDAYRYRRLGFRAQLRNDLLTLQGIKREGEKEFLVEGSFIPPTVNIVSHTQKIGFKELLRRLERISQTRADQGPIVQ